MRTPLRALVMIAAMGANACDSTAMRPPVEAHALTPVAQHPVRLSERDEITLVSDTLACVVDSYESNVACYKPQGVEVVVWGREGEGPGEFPEGGPRNLVGMGSEQIGAWNSVHRRLSVFRVDGAHIADLSLPAPGIFAGGPTAFHASAEGGDRLWLTAVSPTGELSFATVEFDLATQQIVWEHPAETIQGVEPCERINGAVRPGAVHSNGSLHYFYCRGSIVHLPDPKGDGRVFVEEMPT